MAEASKKRKDLSLQEKQRILECYDKLPKTFLLLEKVKILDVLKMSGVCLLIIILMPMLGWLVSFSTIVQLSGILN